jgi:hypothetical protein
MLLHSGAIADRLAGWLQRPDVERLDAALAILNPTPIKTRPQHCFERIDGCATDNFSARNMIIALS